MDGVTAGGGSAGGLSATGTGAGGVSTAAGGSGGSGGRIALEAGESGACSGMACVTGALGTGARSCTATRLARCGEASMTVLSQAPAAKVKTRPMAMATDFRFMFLVRASATPSKPVQSGSACLMQIAMQVLKLREYKNTNRLAGRR
jgi:hypothetical protein